MKTQLSKPARSKARYTEEYKQEAMELWRASGRSAAKVAAELGIRAPLLYRWARPKRQALRLLVASARVCQHRTHEALSFGLFLSDDFDRSDNAAAHRTAGQDCSVRRHCSL